MTARSVLGLPVSVPAVSTPVREIAFARVVNCGFAVNCSENFDDVSNCLRCRGPVAASNFGRVFRAYSAPGIDTRDARVEAHARARPKSRYEQTSV